MTTHETIHDSETPAAGQQVITACGFIHHNFGGVEKIFLPKRAATKKFLPGVYEMPGGHIDFGEDLSAGLKREIQEELHKDVSVGDPFAAFTYLNKVKGSHSIEVDFFVEFVGATDDYVLNPEDHSTAGWFAEDEIDAILAPDDEERPLIHRGFALLRGEKLRAG